MILLMVIGLLSVSLVSCKKDKEEQVVYLASGHYDWWPVMYKDSSTNSIVGAGPEIVAMIFNELNLKISFPYVGYWDVVQEKAKSGEIDLIVAAYETTERKTYMDYSIPYTIDPVSLFVKKGETFPFNSWTELLNKNGVVTVGDSYGQAFDQFIKDSLSVISVTSPEAAFTLILNDQVDYFVYAFYSGEKFLSKKNLKDQIEILPNYVSSENFYITISKKSLLINHMKEINQILEKYIKDGTINRILEKHKL